MQQLLLPRSEQIISEQENYLGLISSLDDPFNLFLRLDELKDPDSDLIYFFVYSLGKKKIMLWGNYSKSEDHFLIEAACRYSVSQLMSVQHYWQDHHYRYVANAVADRVTTTLRSLVSPQEESMTAAEYRAKKTFLAFSKGEIDRKQIDSILGPDYPEKIYDRIILELIESDQLNSEQVNPVQTRIFRRTLERYLVELQRKLSLHEASINLLNLDSNLHFHLNSSELALLKTLTLKFIQKLERSSLQDDKVYAWLPPCPARENCSPGADGPCGVYFYGISRLDPRDLR